MAERTEPEYIENIITALRRMYGMTYQKTQAPTEKLFVIYGELIKKPVETIDMAAVKAGLESALDTLQEVKKKVRKSYKEQDIPPTLRLSLSGARSMITEKVGNAIDACRELLEFVETGDSARLAAAGELLEPMSTAAQAVLANPEDNSSGCARME